MRERERGRQEMEEMRGAEGGGGESWRWRERVGGPLLYCCVRIHFWLIEFLPLGTGASVFILYN